jgi:S-disulfanyl-L-cysteine oxidoreductase SoxD
MTIFRVAALCVIVSSFLSFCHESVQAEEGLYTAAQAEQGHLTFNNYCAECHRPDLTGALGPALIGPAFQKNWAGKKVGDLFNFAHTKMPATNPGSVSKIQDWQIIAYILQRNGYPAGSKELGPQAADQIIPTK